MNKLRRALPLVAGAAIAVGSAVGAIGIAAADEAPSVYRAIAMFDPEGAHGQCGENLKCVGPFARDKDGTSGLPQSLPLTVSAWFKAPADGLDRPIAQHGARTVNLDGADVTPRGWTLERRGADQKIGFALQSSDPGWYKKFELVTPADQWVFVAVSVDATGAMVLHTWDSLNGWRMEAPTGKVTPYVPAAASGQEGFLSVGASKGAPNREFTGQIDDVRVYNVVRTPAEVQADFQTTLAGTEAGLVGYWNFDNATSGGTSVPDLSPNSNDMRLDGPNGLFYYADQGKRIGETPMQVPEYAAAPAVVSATPAGGATDVPVSGPFSIDFSEPMEAVTVAGGVGLTPAAGGAAIPVVVTTVDSTTYGITPTAPLLTGTRYKLTIGAGAKDVQGTGATADERTFTTAGTSTTPTTPTIPTTPTTPTTPTATTQTATTQTAETESKPEPEREERRAGATRVTLSVGQLRINQRISQAALRRVAALEARLEDRAAPPGPARAGGAATFELTAGQLRINQRISQAAVRRVNALAARLAGEEPPRAGGGAGGRFSLSAGQMLINQRISQAAVRRVNELAERVDAGARLP